MRSKFKNMDKTLFFLTIAFTILGLVMIFSASSMTAVLQYGRSESYFFLRQLFFIVLAYVAGFVILFLPNRIIRLLKCFPISISIISIFLLIITCFFGVKINGVRSWLNLGVGQIQPAEFAKTLVIVSIAFYFSSRKAFIRYKYLVPFIFAIISVVLVITQPDLGTGVILAFIVFLMLISLPIKERGYKIIKICIWCFAISGVFLLFFGEGLLKKTSLLNDEQLGRLNYRDPCTRYSEESGYQVCNGYIAINNGGLFGVGLGNSKQKYLYLPEAYTDFVFPIVVEELGSIISGIIILGFLFMLYKILKIAKTSETLTGSLLAFGTFTLITGHLLINLLGVMALIPLTGVPVPFLSNGGSFALNLIILLFITLRVSIENKSIKLKREISNL